MTMHLNAIIERDLATGIMVGSVPGFPGVHSQGETIQEVQANLTEVIEILLAENALERESEFIALTTLGAIQKIAFEDQASKAKPK